MDYLKTRETNLSTDRRLIITKAAETKSDLLKAFQRKAEKDAPERKPDSEANLLKQLTRG
jgi:hypothetical protein